MSITTHQSNGLNKTIEVIPSNLNEAGVPRTYTVKYENAGQIVELPITFHEGDPLAGANGLTQEVLAAILEHRLTAWQNTQFASREAQIAIGKLQECRLWLGERTRLRVERGVEGTPVA